MALDDLSLILGPSQPASPKLEPQRYQPATSPYPVEVLFEAAPQRQRLWAIPVLGFAAKTILLIPHLIILIVLGWFVGVGLVDVWIRLVTSVGAGTFFDRNVVFFAVGEAIGATLVLGGIQLILWLWILIGGRYPTWAYALVGGYLRWSTRVVAFLLGLTDHYPPFTLKNHSDKPPVDTYVGFELPARSVRWWAIPLVAIVVKLISLIPHFIALAVMIMVSAFIGCLIAWIPVLLAGRYPGWMLHVVGGTLRWYVRVYAFMFGLTDRYPPFSLA